MNEQSKWENTNKNLEEIFTENSVSTITKNASDTQQGEPNNIKIIQWWRPSMFHIAMCC